MINIILNKLKSLFCVHSFIKVESHELKSQMEKVRGMYTAYPHPSDLDHQSLLVIIYTCSNCNKLKVIKIKH